MRYGGIILLIATAFVAVACSPSTSMPFSASTSGAEQTVYTGTVVDSINGSGTISVSLANVEGLVSGTWSTSYGGKTQTLYISGKANGTSYSAAASICSDTDQGSSCSPNCPIAFNGSLTSSALTGTYTETQGAPCVADSGTINATH